jgi:hypothetical protein
MNCCVAQHRLQWTAAPPLENGRYLPEMSDNSGRSLAFPPLPPSQTVSRIVLINAMEVFILHE